MKKLWICLFVAALCLAVLCLPALAEEAEGDHGDPSHLKDWDAYEPTIITMDNGVRVQPGPAQPFARRLRTGKAAVSVRQHGIALPRQPLAACAADDAGSARHQCDFPAHVPLRLTRAGPAVIISLL